MEKLILSGSHAIKLRIIRIIQSWKMSCAEYVADMVEKKNVHSFGGNTEGKNHLEDVGIDGRIVFSGS